MPRLLISVRNLEEARLALAGGADLIDIKEPSRGSLGQACASIMSEIARIVGVQKPLSAALGELLDRPLELPPANLNFAKWGLSGCASLENWPDLLAERGAIVRQTNTQCQAVGVIYADSRRAQSPGPFEVCSAAVKVGCAVVLVDTYQKDGANLFDWLGSHELQEIRTHCRQLGLQMALAGGIDFDLLPTVLEIQPDWVAIRGAACEDGRQGTLCVNRVARLAEIVHEYPDREQ